MPDAFILGRNAELAYKVGGQSAGGAWNVITNCKDVTPSGETVEADVTTRGSGKFTQTVPVRINMEVTFQMVWDPEDEAFAAIQDAWYNQAVIGFRTLDKAVGDGGRGWAFDAGVTNFSKAEPLDGVQMVDVTIKPTRSDTAVTPVGWS